MSNFEGYTAGRLLYYSFEANVSTNTVNRLENRFNKLLDETVDLAMVTPAQTIALFNDMGLIVASEYKNPYGLLGDLSEVLGGAGAAYSENGEMVSIRPISRGMFTAFSRGWINSKSELSTRK